jgi:hypothetical protein
MKLELELVCNGIHMLMELVSDKFWFHHMKLELELVYNGIHMLMEWAQISPSSIT